MWNFAKARLQLYPYLGPWLCLPGRGTVYHVAELLGPGRRLGAGRLRQLDDVVVAVRHLLQQQQQSYNSTTAGSSPEQVIRYVRACFQLRKWSGIVDICTNGTTQFPQFSQFTTVSVCTLEPR